MFEDYKIVDLTGQPGSLNYNPDENLPPRVGEAPRGGDGGVHAGREASDGEVPRSAASATPRISSPERNRGGDGGVHGQTPLADRSPITDHRSPTSPPTTHHPQPTALRGWVNAYYIKVGGKRLGPYYARRWKEGGKLRKEYVAEQDVERTKLACELYREKVRQGRAIDRVFTTVVGNLDFLWRAMKRAAKGIHLRPDEMEHLARIEKEGIKAQGRPPRRLPPTERKSKTSPTRSPETECPSATASCPSSTRPPTVLWSPFLLNNQTHLKNAPSPQKMQEHPLSPNEGEGQG